MKKSIFAFFAVTTLSLFVALSLLTISGSSVSAQTADYAPAGSASPTTCTNLTTNLGWGTTSAGVTTLQNYLSLTGYMSVEATGYYGNVTSNAVSSYQTAHSIEGTGYVGPLTRTAIRNESCGTTASAGTAGTNIAAGSVVCPAGMTCTRATPAATPAVCPLGYVCKLQTDTVSTIPTYVPGLSNNMYGSLSGIYSLNNTGSGQQLAPAPIAMVSANHASDPNVIDPTTSNAISNFSLVAKNSDTVPVQAALSIVATGTYPVTINYSQAFDDMLSIFQPRSSSDTVGLELFPQSGSGQKNLVAKIFALGELFPNVIGTNSTGTTIDPYTAGRCRVMVCPINVNITYEQFTATIKAKGYRPATLQEIVALAGRYPQISGVAYGSITKVADVRPYAQDYYSITAPYISGAKEMGNVNIGLNSFQIVRFNSMNMEVKDTPIVVIEDGSWLPSTLQSLPTVSSPANVSGGYSVGQANYAVPGIKYTVQVGDQRLVMKLLTIRPPTSNVQTWGGTSPDTIKSLLPSGYRFATTDEMVALNTQYPNARAYNGNTAILMGLMAFGSPLTSCGGIPWIHSEGLGVVNAGAIRNEVDERRLGFNPPTQVFLFPIVRL